MNNFACSHRLHSEVYVLADGAKYKSITTCARIHVYTDSADAASDVAMERAFTVFLESPCRCSQGLSASQLTQLASLDCVTVQISSKLLLVWCLSIIVLMRLLVLPFSSFASLSNALSRAIFSNTCMQLSIRLLTVPLR